MTATHTQDIAATVAQVNALHAAGADVVRIAVDSKKDADALAEIRQQTQANLSVDLQENYRHGGRPVLPADNSLADRHSDWHLT